MHTARVVGITVAAAALVAAFVGTSGLPDQAGSSLLLGFGAVVALGLTRHGSPR